MTDSLKVQARRLQSFVQANPAHARALSEGKHAACLEAVAAVHGYRNWNTLQAKHAGALPLSHADPVAPSPSAGTTSVQPVVAGDGESVEVFGGLHPRDVQYLYGRSGAGKSYGTALDLVNALAEGCTATVLDVGRSYHHLCLAFGGLSTTPDKALLEARLTDARMVAVEFEGWRLTQAVHGSAMAAQRWAGLRPLLEMRCGPGHVLVVDEVHMLASLFGDDLMQFLAFLQVARKLGSVVHLIGQVPQDFAAYRDRVPPTREVEVTRASRPGSSATRMR